MSPPTKQLDSAVSDLRHEYGVWSDDGPFFEILMTTFRAGDANSMFSQVF